MMNKNIVVAILVVVLVALGSTYLFKKPAHNKLPAPTAPSVQEPPETEAESKQQTASEAEKAKYEAMVEKYTQAIQNEDGDANSYYQRALAYYRLGRYRQAIQDYTRALNITPDSANAYFNRAQAYFAEGMQEDALKDYTQAITLKPDDPRIFNSRGLLYAQKQDYENALNDYQKAVSLDPSYARAYYNRGLVHELQNKNQEAVEEYTQAINNTKKDLEDVDNAATQDRLLEAYLRRAAVYLKLNQVESALKDANFIIETNPNYAKAYHLRSQVYKAKGDNSSAAADESKASSIELEQVLGGQQQ